MRAHRLMVPLALLALGTYLLIGCIPIPGNHKPRGRERPESFIGRSTSSKPLRLGHATRPDVEAVLGPPRLTSGASDAVVYTYTVNTVTVVWPLCFYAQPEYDPRFLVLRFDVGGRLARYKVYKTEQDVRRDVPDLGELLPSQRPGRHMPPRPSPKSPEYWLGPPPATMPRDPNAPPRDAVPYRTVPGGVR